MYRRAIRLAESLGEIGFLAYLFRALARLERWSGNYLGALEWLRRAELAPASSQANSPGSNSQSMRGAILLEMGHAEDALALLDQTCAELEQAGAIVDLAQGRLTLARAQFRCGREAEAFASLRQAFTLAEQVGYDQMLVAEALAARDVLESARAAPGIGLKATALIGRAEAAQAVLTHIRARSEPILASRPPTIEVRALGGSRVLREGAEIAPGDWASQQARELFLYLVEAAPVRREHILEIFWPDTTSARATANFHGVLHRLRRAVGRDVVVFHAERGEYRLSPGLEIAYDADRFERSARAALAIAADDPRRAASLAAAIELYGGDYLADLPVEWALERRRALCDLYVEVLCESADQLMRLTRYAEARQTLARALAREPLRDDLHSLMLRCLAAMGRRHEVVEHYQRYRQTLRAELGLDPPAESRALYARLIE
ncbi:MAG: hypothetical protein HY023_03660 [Chloroflexi bacterium]|nr:hypothetical protein [Chloroflexota bacterium]